MANGKRLVLIALAAAGAYWVYKKNTEGKPDWFGDFSPTDWLSEGYQLIKSALSNGAANLADEFDVNNNDYMSSVATGRGNKYYTRLEQIGARFGLPPRLLSAIAWKESRYRDDIITGKTKSGAGAAGMFQLMPMHWKSVDPLNWEAAAEYAAKMLAGFYRQFGNSWFNAIAAYNGYPRVIKEYKARPTKQIPLSAVSKETADYVTTVYGIIEQVE
jgi:soluble lytic murein transglycosylase-like protein